MSSSLGISEIHIFPSFQVEKNGIEIGKFKFNRRDSILKDEHKDLIEELFLKFGDIQGDGIGGGAYIINQSHSEIHDLWMAAKYSVFTPSQIDFINGPPLDVWDWFHFSISEHGISSVFKNGEEIWDGFSRHDFPIFQRNNTRETLVKLSEQAQIQTDKLFELLISPPGQEDTEKLASQIRQAIFWYNKSFELTFSKVYGKHKHEMNLKSEILFLAISFETLFVPPKEGIAKHLETSLKVLFPYNDFIPIWLNQFYSIRSAIVHGDLVKLENFLFKPDNTGEHFSLAYWGRVIFRASIDALLTQWKSSTDMKLLSSMMSNRKRLMKLSGILKNEKISTDIWDNIPPEIGSELMGLHSNWFDIPDEQYLKRTAEIGAIFLSKILPLDIFSIESIKSSMKEIVSYGDGWPLDDILKREVFTLYKTIFTELGENPESPYSISNQSDKLNDQQKYAFAWFHFAFSHLWIVLLD